MAATCAAAQPIFTTAPPELSRVTIAPPPQALAPEPQASVSAPVMAEPPPAFASPAFASPPLAQTSVSQTSALHTPAPAPSAASSMVADAPMADAPLAVPPSGRIGAAPAAHLAGAPSAPVSTPLRHLNNNMQGFRLAGEIASSEWPVYLTARQARQNIRFQVGYLAAVSVMPEASYLTVIVNDKVVGRVNIRTANAVRTVHVDVPAGLMQPGFNAIRLTAEQRHRVDCSLAATFELWTQIDPSQTGLLFAQHEAIETPSDLSALSPDAQGALPIRAVTPERTSLANVERILRVVQMISLVGRFTQPVVDYGPVADGDYGLNLIIGAAGDIGGVADLEALGAIVGPRVVVQPAAAGRRTTVIVTGRDDAEVDEALAAFKPEGDAFGAPAGVRAAAAFPGYRMEGGAQVRLSELGVASEEFSGRLFRTAFNIIMPPDFYSADYAKAELSLAGGYAPGLTSEARIVVSVNGRNAVSLKLPKSRGDVFENNSIPLPLGAMRPGLNRVEIEAQTPMESDRACDPIAAIGSAKRFLFLDSTRLTLPKIARIARMPDLAVTATGGFPYTDRLRPKLIVPAPDRASIGAATTVAAQIAIAAGRPIDFSLSGSAPQPGDGAVLIVGGANTLDPRYLRLAGVDVEDVAKAWSSRFDAPANAVRSEALTRYEATTRQRVMLERNFPAACRMTRPLNALDRMTNGRAKTFAERAGAPARVMARSWEARRVEPSRPLDRSAVGSLKTSGANAGSLFEEWNAKVRAPNAVTSYFERMTDGVGVWARDTWSAASGLVARNIASGGGSTPLDARASLFVAQNILGSSAADVWTVIAAPNAQELADAVPCLVDPRVWGQISGRMATLDTNTGAVTAAPAPVSQLIVTQPLTIGNLRMIAAGWLSLNAHVYVALALGLALLLAFATTTFVRNTGRRTP